MIQVFRQGGFSHIGFLGNDGNIDSLFNPFETLLGRFDVVGFMESVLREFLDRISS
jgi:hypothetical protein